MTDDLFPDGDEILQVGVLSALARLLELAPTAADIAHLQGDDLAEASEIAGFLRVAMPLAYGDEYTVGPK